MKRLRAIWSEGTFAALKREHNLKRARKRGLNRMSEECLLSALTLNPKRIVKADPGQHPYFFDSTRIFQYQLCSKWFSQIIILILSTGPIRSRPPGGVFSCFINRKSKTWYLPLWAPLICGFPNWSNKRFLSILSSLTYGITENKLLFRILHNLTTPASIF